jgi:glutamyl-tRNA synthetase
MIRVRFAPSPTGYLHVGGARTALFNWLLARRHGGAFVLRIEDTDVERSSDAMVEGILDGLRWLGLDWDEGPKISGPYGPYFQSERLAIYREDAELLVRRGAAYFCYCTPEELKARREAAEAQGDGWRYDRACCTLTSDEIAAREREKRPRAIRVRVPDGAMAFDDLVHGRIEFDGSNLEDFIVMRSDGYPTYHLTVVSDDVRMKITHVIRGDDHISNTPKQLLLYRALGAEPPHFAHVPLILGPDRKRLSKRHGATSVVDYAARGYLPEAMINFIGLLGWSPGSGDREIFTREELTAAFDLAGISGGDAVFNVEKLDWFNQQYMMRLSGDDLVGRVEPVMREAGLWRDTYSSSERGWLARVLDLLKPRVRRLPDFSSEGTFFFKDVELDDAAVAKHLKPAGTRPLLQAMIAAIERSSSFTAAELETLVRGLAAERGVKAGALIHATRVAVTGRGNSPGLFEVLELLGCERTLERLAAAVPFAGE